MSYLNLGMTVPSDAHPDDVKTPINKKQLIAEYAMFPPTLVYFWK